MKLGMTYKERCEASNKAFLEEKARKELGETKFALFPVELTDGSWVWLQKYEIKTKYELKTNYNWAMYEEDKYRVSEEKTASWD